VLGAGDPAYEESRRVFNAMIERRPAAILRCSCAEDVAHGVTVAREYGLPISVKGGGHSVAGNAVCEDGLMLDMSGMKRISVDPERGLTVAEAGLTLGEFDAATARYGLATTLGVVSMTGIAGLTLGGVPAERGESLLEFTVTAYCLVPGDVVGDLRHDRLLLLQVGEQSIQTSRGEHPVAGEHVEVALSGILRQVADLTGAVDRARVWFGLAGEDAHGGGLPCAVPADEADAVTGLDPQRGPVDGQQRARAGADLQVRCGDHACSPLLVVGEDCGPLLGARGNRFLEIGGE